MINKKNTASARLGKKIKEIRKSYKMSGNELARKLGMSQQQVSRYESGKSSMTIDTIILIANALEISINELLTDYLTSENDNTLIL